MPLVFFYGVDMLIGWCEFPSPDVVPSEVISPVPAIEDQPTAAALTVVSVAFAPAREGGLELVEDVD